MKRGIRWLACLLALAAGGVFADTHYVAQGGQTPEGTYTNWETAASNIQAAVNAAVSGDIVLVSNGYYTATGEQVVDINRSIEVRGVDGREITIIDGENARRCVKLYATTTGNPIYLSGFTIRNGITNNGSGGGIYADGSRNIYVTDCVIVSNYSSGANGGAGVYKAVFNCAMTLSNCDIVCNSSATAGGGVSANRGKLYLVDCLIAHNTADSAGGGLYSMGSAASVLSFDMRACTVVSNTALAGYGGGGVCLATEAGVSNIIADSTIAFNSAAKPGGGLFMRGTATYPCKVRVSNCVFMENTGDGGGGVEFNGLGELMGCLIVSNYAKNGVGGGVKIGTTNYPVRLENLTIAANSNGTATGGGFYVLAASPGVMLNSIVYGNQSGTTASNVSVVGAGFTFTNSCTAPLTGVAGEGNYNGDPLFEDEASGNFLLQTGSSCVNAGLNQEWMATALDLDGRARLDRFSGRVDMGAFERVPAGVLMKLR